MDIGQNDKQCQIDSEVRSAVDVGVGNSHTDFVLLDYESLCNQDCFESLTGVNKEVFDYFLWFLQKLNYNPSAFR